MGLTHAEPSSKKMAFFHQHIHVLSCPGTAWITHWVWERGHFSYKQGLYLAPHPLLCSGLG